MIENRPSKKQRELFTFIDEFIKTNGYGPSYREIMRALDYKSVSTVAVHIDGLIARGWLRKTDNSARSLEVITDPLESRPKMLSEQTHIDWLKNEIEKRQNQQTQDEAAILTQALNILLDQKAEQQV